MKQADSEEGAHAALRPVSGFKVVGGACVELCFAVGRSVVMSPAACASNKPQMPIIPQLREI